jgi:hypothetical protein
MVNLNSLPVEVILMILGCFEDELMLLSISVVSKRLCSIAQPRLFREITLDSSNLPSLFLLLRTVILRPHLAAHVLSLEIDDAVDSDEESEPDCLAEFSQERKHHTIPLDFLGTEFAAITEEVRNLKFLCQDAAPSILETTDAGVLSTLLISFTSNLYHLSIAVDHRHFKLLLNLAKTLGDGASRPLGLGRLRSLHLECLEDRNGSEVTFRDVALLLPLLQLTEFQLRGCAGYSWEEAAQSRLSYALDKSLSLSTISVTHSDLDAESTKMLCRSCKRLTAFHYDECDMGNEELSHQQLHSALYSQRQNLVNLQVGLSRNDHCGVVFSTDAQNGSFREYINAKFMGVDQLFLGILPQLPCLLEHLAILHCRVAVLQTLVFFGKPS